MILLVEDDAIIREGLESMLECYRFNVRTAENGVDALSQFVKYRNEIQVIWTDLNMPKMDGVTLIRELNKMKAQVKIIVSSGNLLNYDLVELRTLGMDRYVGKPYNNKILKDVMHVLSSIA